MKRILLKEVFRLHEVNDVTDLNKYRQDKKRRQEVLSNYDMSWPLDDKEFKELRQILDTIKPNGKLFVAETESEGFKFSTTDLGDNVDKYDVHSVLPLDSDEIEELKFVIDNRKTGDMLFIKESDKWMFATGPG